MSDLQIPSSNDVSALKKIEKKIIKEGKTEDAAVSHQLKDLTKLEKASNKAAKALDKSQHALEKTHQKEHSVIKDLNKAKHKHDLALAAVSNAEKDVETRKAEAERLQNELAKKKGDVNETVEGQKTHNSRRESRLAEIHHVRAGTTNSSPASASTPSVANSNITGTDRVDSPTLQTVPTSAAAVDEKVTTNEAGIAGIGAGTAPAVKA